MYDDVDAVCPFFRSSEMRKIVCDGFTDRCSMTINFKGNTDRNLHRRVFCNRKYENCEVYRMLEECNAE